MSVVMDVVVVGSCNMDLVSYVPRLPTPGETLHGSVFEMGFGGKGCNQCVMAAKLGATTAMVAKVGDDDFGRQFKENMRQHHVDIRHVSVTTEAATGVAPIAVDENGQNSIIIVSGANLLLTPSDVREAVDVIKGAAVLVCQLEVSVETTLAALKFAKEHNVKTILNPAPAHENLPEEIFRYTDIYCPNETEAGMNIDNVEDAEKAVETLLNKGCQAVIITLGAQGSVYATQSEPCPVLVPAQTVTALDASGAGDAFVGSLAYYLSKHPDLSLGEQIKRAGRIATTSVLSKGTQRSFPVRTDLAAELFK